MAKKKSTTATHKRKLDEITAELPTKEELSQRLRPLIPSSEAPRLLLPPGLDLESPYAIFTLFISEEIFEFISQSTNAYARREIAKLSDSATTSATTAAAATTPRVWKDTTTGEIKVFFGILIYMGVHPEPRIDLYWQQDRREGPLHSPPLYMTLKRFEQIKRYLHISHPDEDEKRSEKDIKQWWYKVEPLSSSFKEAAQKHYQPGSNISIDETMIRCFGRTKHTVKMPKKPIQQGYKIFALAEHGYIWTFTWTSRLWGIIDNFRWEGLSPTASMVVNMIKELPGLAGCIANLPTTPIANSLANLIANSPANSMANLPTTPIANSLANSPTLAPYIIYMDNYFTSVALFKELRDIRCGVCGTTRPQNRIPS
jgi:hypothetical protein